MEKELITEMRRTSELSEELLIKAKEELGETDNIREESLILIKEWIPTQINDYSNLGKWFYLWIFLFSSQFLITCTL